MKLDRNLNPDGRGKYALVLMREIPENDLDRDEVESALSTLNHHGCLDYGEAADNEFFVIRLKDRSAEAGLFAYSKDAESYDMEYAAEVRALADKAATHLNKKQPD